MRSRTTEQPKARLIVCERSGKWAVAMRRSSQIGSCRVYETRSPEECRDEVQASPASLVAVEATTANFEDILDWLAELRRDFPLCHVVVLGHRGLQRGQWLLREAGAAHVVHSPRDVDAVIRIASRQLKGKSDTDQLTRERLLDRIPW
jgi:hypothetical protein